MFAHPFTASGSHLREILTAYPRDRFGQRIRVVGHPEATFLLLKRIPWRAPAGDDRNAVGQGFRNHHAEIFRKRRNDTDVRVQKSVDLVSAVDPSGKPDKRLSF